MKWTTIFLVGIFSWSALADEAPKLPEWENNAEASLLLTSGNTEVTTLGLGLGSIYRPDPWTVKGKGAYVTSKTVGVKTAESLEFGLRGERKITEALSGYLSSSFFKNEFAGFESRWGLEAGISYLLLSEEAHTLTTDLGFGFLKENLISGPMGASLGDRSFATGRLGVEYKWKISPSAELSDSLSLLENFSETSDWRLSNQIALTTIMTDMLSLKVGFKVDYLNTPVSGKKSTDTATTVALVAKF